MTNGESHAQVVESKVSGGLGHTVMTVMVTVGEGGRGACEPVTSTGEPRTSRTRPSSHCGAVGSDKVRLVDLHDAGEPQTAAQRAGTDVNHRVTSRVSAH